MKCIVVLVTAGSHKEANGIADALVRKRLAACVTIVGERITSVYRWKGKVETGREVLMLIKTTRRKFDELAREVRRLHSYETPEIIAMPIIAGSKPYLRWIEESIKD